MAKQILKKAQNGIATSDSTAYFKKKAADFKESASKKTLKGDISGGKKDVDVSLRALYDEFRQSEKGRPGKDANGYPVKKKMGGMIKRADGSMSKRGLWDNIRANKGSGKKPTAAMLKQEKKIKANTKKK
jgi:hypothetical protein